MDLPLRVFIVGAGFSAAAGLPLGDDLLKEVLDAAHKVDDGQCFNEIIQNDIHHYEQYQQDMQEEGHLTIEGFLSFLDIEHHLCLAHRTWQSGNKTQMIVRNLIAWVLWNCMCRMTEDQRSLYRSFVRQLHPRDWVISLNYDVLLEEAMIAEEIPFRLVPVGFSKQGTEDDGVNEVQLLKLHGSIDWFDYRPEREFQRECIEVYGERNYLKHKVFTKHDFHHARPIGEHLDPDCRLADVYKADLSRYLEGPHHWVTEAPLILSPSYYKLVYAPPLLDLWRGLGMGREMARQMAIIGFSMPAHDAYLKQLLWSMTSSYQCNDSDKKKWIKDPLRLLDLRTSEAERDCYKKAYAFVDWTSAETWFDGFRLEALPFLFGSWIR